MNEKTEKVEKPIGRTISLKDLIAIAIIFIVFALVVSFYIMSEFDLFDEEVELRTVEAKDLGYSETYTWYNYWSLYPYEEILQEVDLSNKQLYILELKMLLMQSHCRRFDLLIAKIDPVNSLSGVVTIGLHPSDRTQGILDTFNNNLSLNANKINDAIQEYSEPGELSISEVVEGKDTITIELLILHPEDVMAFTSTINKDYDITEGLNDLFNDSTDDGDGVEGYIIEEE